MRLKVEMQTNRIPILYRHRIISLIKEALQKADKQYKEELYSKNIAKPFSFYLQIPTKTRKAKIQLDENFIIEDDVVDLEKPINLYISSSDYNFIITLLAGLPKIKTFYFSNDNHMLVENEKITIQINDIKILNEKQITSNYVIFKTNAPIFLRDNNNKPVFFDNNFEEELNNVTNNRLKTIQKRKLITPLKFEPIDMKRVIVKHTLRDFRKITNRPIMYLSCNFGIFKLYGHPIDLDFVYKAGIGNITGQGFGMVDIL